MAETNPQSKKTISELQQLNEELENYFRSTIIPQLFFDKDMILRKYSPAAVVQFNLREADIGKHLNELSNNLRYHTLEDDLQQTMDLNSIIEKEIQTMNDKWYRMNVLPYFQKKERKTNGAIITFIDINNYVISLKELQKLNSEHEIFIYSVSHDLKAPLTNIEGLIGALKDSIDKNDRVERDRIIDMLRFSAGKAKEIINDLTRISQTGSKLQGDQVVIRLDDLLNEVCLTIKDKIDESNARIEVDFRINEIHFSRKDLRSILYNLLSNAIKYRSYDRNPVISIKTKWTDDFILLAVKDNGMGIEEDKKGIIFSQFTRVIDNVEGTGVGLYLVSKIADAHGGKVVVNSKVNEGSEFLVYLKV